MDDRILEPQKYYIQQLEQQFADSTKQMFDDLVKQSGISEEANRATCKEYYAELENIKNASQLLAKKRSLKGFLVFCCVLMLITAVVGVVGIVQQLFVAIVGVILAVVGVALFIVFLMLIKKKVNPAIQDADALVNEHQKIADEKKAEAFRQMSPLNRLFDSDMTRKLIVKAVPLLTIDRNFNVRRYDYLSGKYGFGPTDENESVLNVMSGEIIGNPFVIQKKLVMNMGMETYTGSLVITWTTHYTDSQGHSHTQVHTETLHASVQKPKPFYSRRTTLIYGNDAAPDLSFSHEPTHAERLSERELERKVRQGERKIEKMARKSISKGGNFTDMSNDEFDVLFNALDRDNEVQFRLLFTPLAQKNMLALMKGEPYGDDFYFDKRKCLNYVSSEHSQSWEIDTDASRYRSFDVDVSRQEFYDFNTGYFKSLFFDFAPLLSLPLYQQHKPKEYIYKDVYANNYTGYEAETLANEIGSGVFAHPETQTKVILKTQFVAKSGASDLYRVDAHSFTTIPHTDFVSVFGGDGNFHSVPVDWLEYVPITAQGEFCMKQLDFSDVAYMDNTDVQKTGSHCAYKHGIFAGVTNSSLDGFESALNKILKKN